MNLKRSLLSPLRSSLAVVKVQREHNGDPLISCGGVLGARTRQNSGYKSTGIRQGRISYKGTLLPFSLNISTKGPTYAETVKKDLGEGKEGGTQKTEVMRQAEHLTYLEL